MGRHRPSSSHCPYMPCGWSSSWQGLHPYSSFSSFCLRSPLSPCGTCGGRTSLVHCGVVMSARQGVLEPWESVAEALPSFLGVALVEPPWLPSPPLPLGLPPEPPVDFMGMSLMHTFLWLCKAEDDRKACFRHFPHP